MSIALIPFWIPLLWSFMLTIFWRLKMREPFNHWAICALVFAVNLFWFAYSCVFFLTIVIVRFSEKKEKKTEDKTDEPTK